LTETRTYHGLSDKQLLERVDSNNVLSIVTVLFERYKEQVFGVSLKYLQSVPNAEDACMEIYQLVLKKILTSDIKNFKPWLYTVSKNYCLDLIRKKKRRIEKNDAYQLVQNDQVYHPYNEEDDVNEKLLTKLSECMEELSASQKLIVKLFYLEKRSYKEITEMEDLSWNKVRTLLQNGRRNLKICLEK
jgi:RNA polymerase sigma-70 factor (ECF subfamily)